MKTLTKLGGFSAIALTTALLAVPGVSSAGTVTIPPDSATQTTTVPALAADPLHVVFDESGDPVETFTLTITDSTWASGQLGQLNITDSFEPCTGNSNGAGCSDVIRWANNASGQATIYFWSGVNGFVPGTDDAGWSQAIGPSAFFNEEAVSSITIKTFEIDGHEIVLTFTGEDFSGQFSDILDISVPEPATLALLATGLLGMGLSRRRQIK